MTVFQTVDSDATLPSVAASPAAQYAAEELIATVVFHPDTSRIGENTVLPLQSRPCTLGRLEPLFSGSGGGAGSPLNDRHISRRAIELAWHDTALTVRRLPDASRCRLAAQELDKPLELDLTQLRAGVPLLLAHSVVLLLRMAPAGVASGEAPSIDSDLLGSSRYMAQLRHQLRQIADSGLDVLVQGETGTGKELVARAIHRTSARSGGPLIAVNMAAIPCGLAAASLFGSRKGAYTGADRAALGYFEQAQGGTLFLDEVGDAAPEIQPQLLRALQQREIQQVGGAVRPVDLRVISATDAAIEGTDSGFSSALRHRLGACEVQLRPLREHPEDIGELTWHFLQQAAREQGREALLESAQSSPRITAAWADLFYRFLAFHWPGNVRQLANFANQVIVASEDYPVLPVSVQRALRDTGVEAVSQREDTPDRRAMRDVPGEEFERVYAESLFEVAPTARRLNVSRQSIYRHIDDSPRHRRASQVPLSELRAALTTAGGDVAAAALQLRVSASGLRTRLRAAGLE